MTKTKKTLRGGPCLTYEDLQDVTALYFEGEGSIFVREGVGEPEECAIQVGLVNAYFVKRSDNTVAGDMCYADITDIAQDGEQVVVSRIDKAPTHIYMGMANQRRALLKALYLRCGECRGIGFPEELLEEDQPIRHAVGGHQLPSTMSSPSPDRRDDRVVTVTPTRLSGHDGVGQGVRPSLLPKATAPLRAAIAVLTQLEEGNGGPSSHQRRLSQYCVDALYAPPPPGMAATAYYASPPRVSTTGTFLSNAVDGGHRVQRYGGIDMGGTAVSAFLAKTEKAASPPAHSAQRHNMDSHDEYEHLGKAPEWVEAAQRERRLRGEINSVLNETTEVERQVSNLQERKVEAAKLHRSITMGFGRRSTQPDGSKPGGNAASRNPASERPADHSAVSGALGLDALTNGEPVETVNIAALIKKTHPLPPKHDPEELKYTTERELNRWEARSEGSSHSSATPRHGLAGMGAAQLSRGAGGS
eukprot:TRINITY_DN33014_c0_g1_i1.p1 TRINITY_DN33014_c0_g1~~TRINITY_DN33014_c0_g1_i1.p1  ORF type:complete len:473 (+),score=114.75 TRINITY_DN33014_c0_g1_i1:69-1487(+)